MKRFSAIGVMSGSSLDGLDISFGTYQNSLGKWTYEHKAGATIPFSNSLIDKLKDCRNLSGLELQKLDIKLGQWIGAQIKIFVENQGETPDLIGSHGHTVFHNPGEGYTVQIGNGQAIASQSGLLTINNFRLEDVLKGGQGAPLVPIGDVHLFNEYDAWLNLGGIANATVRAGERILAWDICPANQVLNHLAELSGKSYDKGGVLAKSGKIISKAIDKWSRHTYYQQSPPRSMSNEWVTREVIDQLPDSNPADLSASFCRFVADQMALQLKEFAPKKMLVTGGGAYHSFLIDQIKLAMPATKIEIPNPEIIDFKEAITFGLLGVLRNIGENNVLAEVTGASSDSCSGNFFYP
ncbi:MAG: anhydro-N-acetylmuramic acid kinase [Cyclobacteriaceae bacterium]